jgi:peptidoglycan/LPS O-acetylase OafA/YrhL
VGSRVRGQLDQSWIGELDGLRALACLAVIIVHFNPGWAVAPGWSIYSLSRGVAQMSGANLGVIFFYTLSAFLLTYLAVREHGRSGTFDVKRFYMRRCLRIWPLYFTFLTVAISMVAVDARTTEGHEQWIWTKDHLWLFLGFISNWSLAFNHMGTHVDHSSSALAIVWSIAVEEQFYFVYPVLIGLVLASRRRARGFLMALTMCALASRVLFLFLPVGNPSMGSAGGMYYATSTYLDVFAAGATAGWFAARQSTLGYGLLWLQRRWVGVLLGASLIAACVTWREQFWYPYSYAAVVMYSATGVLFAVLLLWMVVNRDASVCRVLRSTPLRTLGVLSFGMYLWHPVAQRIVNANLSRFAVASDIATELKTALSFILYILVCLGITALTYGLIERPALALKTRFAAVRSSRRDSEAQRSTTPWREVLAAVAVGAMLIEVALLLGLGGVARTQVGSLVPIGPRLPAVESTGFTAAQLTRILDVRVEAAPGEMNQYLLRAEQGSVDLSRLGRIHTNLGYAVGVTLPSGAQIGFRYAPAAAGGLPPTR